MFTVALSFYAEDAKRTVVAFSEFLLTGNHKVINTEFTEKDGRDATVKMMVATEFPEILFQCLEDYAMGGLEPPRAIDTIYFEEMVYYIHAMPENINLEKVMLILNFVLNLSSVNRIQTSRLRNLVNANDPGDNLDAPLGVEAIHQAINILSQKVLGKDILKLINQKEEVTWPVH